MKARTRFIKSVIKTASENQAAPLPWTRGAARSQSRLRRRGLAQPATPKSA